MDFTTVDHLQRELDNYRPLNQTEIKRLMSDFIIDYTYNTNAIEGNAITLRETALIINENMTISGKPLTDHLDIINLKEAFYYVLELTHKRMLTESDILNIHNIVLRSNPEGRGRYRNIPVRIAGSVHTPPQPYEIRPRIEQLLFSYQEKLTQCHILESVSWFHLEFETIHPFVDGNGRTGRLLLNLELIKNGYMPINIKFADKNKYYDCFDDYRTSGKSDMLTGVVLEYEINELKQYLEILKTANVDKKINSEEIELEQ